MIFTIPPQYNGKTLKELLKKELVLSRAAITALKVREDGMLLDGKRVTVRALLSEGQTLSLAVEDRAEDENLSIKPVFMPLSVLYEDGDVIALNKPSGMPTHPSKKHQEDTLANGLVYYYREKGVPFVFRAINRLDRDTSGCVLVAKNKNAAYFLSRRLSTEFEKKYTAIACGRLEQSGTVEANIIRAEESKIKRRACESYEGQPARTEYVPLRYIEKEDITVLSVTPVTGRTHQIRVHLSHIGHPILGDTLYGSPSGDSRISRQALHCSQLGFPLPSGGRISVIAPLYSDMETILKETIN